MRTLPEPVSETSRWLLACGLAFFMADAASATLERRLNVDPTPMGEIVLPAPSAGFAASPDLVKLLSVTRPPAAMAAPAVDGLRKKAAEKPAEEQLSVTLVGTMAGAGGGGLAMLTVAGESVVASTGEPVADWTVRAVYPTSVSLERREVQRTLELNEPAILATARSSGPGGLAPSEPLGPQAHSPAISSEAPPSSEPTPSAPAEPLTSRKEMLAILDNDMAKLMKQGRVRSVVREGEVIGMEIGIKDPAFPLARLGLRTGDIVMSLNSVEVRGPQDMGKLMGTLRNSNSLSFEIERQGQKTTHTVELED